MSVVFVTRTAPSTAFSLASAADVATTALPITVSSPTPWPSTNLEPINWIFITLVVPFSPTGTPAVIKIKSPSLAKPASLAFSVAKLNISSVEAGVSATTGKTPQFTAKLRRVRSSNVTAKISASGRYLEIMRAV